jgi:hypothetical protein
MSNVYFAARRVAATVHGVVFNILILVGSAEAPPCPSASRRLHHPIPDDDDGGRLGTVALLVERFNIFTNSPCTNSFPQITCPVCSGSSLPSMPEIVSPASRTMICPAAMSQGCRLRSSSHREVLAQAVADAFSP